MKDSLSGTCFLQPGLNGDAASLKEMLLFIAPEDYRRRKNDKVGALDPSPADSICHLSRMIRYSRSCTVISGMPRPNHMLFRYARNAEADAYEEAS
jgi:hypothetical protein